MRDNSVLGAGLSVRLGTALAAIAFVLAALAAGPPPVRGAQGLRVTTGSLPDGTAGVYYHTTVAAGGGTGPYSWSATNLPQGLVISASSGVISGTATAAGKYRVTVRVGGPGGEKAAKTLSLTVKVSPLTATATIDSNKLVTVSGVLTSGAGRRVSVMITDPKGRLEYLGDTTATTGGKFSLSYTMRNNVTGDYKVAVGADGLPGCVETSFTYGSKPSLNASIDGSNQVTISGCVNAGIGQRVSLMITGPQGESTYLGDTTTTTGGHFDLSFVMSKPLDGIYKVAAGSSSLSSPLTTSFASGNVAEAEASINKNKLVTVSGFMGSTSGEQVTIMITAPRGKAEYLGDTTTVAGGVFSLSYNMFNSTQGTYKVLVGSPMRSVPLATSFVYYRRDNADLKSLNISEGTLSTAFARGVTAYTAVVNNSISRLTVTPTPVNPAAVIKVNGTVVANGNASGAIDLNVGSNTINVVVTAQDGITTKTYTVTVTRQPPPSGGLAAAATPEASPLPGGTPIGDFQYVTLIDSTPGAVIYYTTDGTQPKLTSSSGSSGIKVRIDTVDPTETIEAMAVAPGYADSKVAIFTYTVAS